MMFTSVVLPHPERPNSATTPGCRGLKSRVELEVRAPAAYVDLQHHERAPRPRRRLKARGEPLGEQQAGETQRAREQREARCHCAAIRRLQRRVEGERQRARLAGNVGYEGDDRTELAEPGGERRHRAREHARQHQRQRDGEEAVERAGAERARRILEAPIDAFERDAHRAHHQRERHHRGGERGAGRAENELDAERVVQPRTPAVRAAQRGSAARSRRPPVAAPAGRCTVASSSKRPGKRRRVRSQATNRAGTRLKSRLRLATERLSRRASSSLGSEGCHAAASSHGERGLPSAAAKRAAKCLLRP